MKIGHHHSDKTPPNGVTNSTPASAANSASNAAQSAAASQLIATAATASTASAIPATADASAKIELSSTASTLLSNNVSDEFDAEKVARISAAIDDGSFKINPEKIADKLISNAQELLSKVQS